MTPIYVDFQKDIKQIQQIPIISTLLNVICKATGMGFAAVARVTEDRWIACSVQDEIQFGLVPGSQLKLETTICNEIRYSHQAVVIDNVQESEAFRNHHTPLLYGFQSYISFPIILKTGEFFGTLCAIDPKPAQLDNPKIKGLFTAFAGLISFHLQQLDLLEESWNIIKEQAIARQRLEESENRYRDLSNDLERQVQTRTRELHESIQDLKRSNENLQQFAYIASHDLQEPLRKIQSFGDILRTKRAADLGEDVDYLTRMQSAANRMSTLIKDLLAYSQISTQQEAVSLVPLNQVVGSVLQDLEMAIRDTNAQIDVDVLPTVLGDRRQLEQLLQNLLSNALKFCRADVLPHIQVRARTIAASALPSSIKPNRKTAIYHRIDVTDNGIGFDEKYLDRVFQVFQRLHTKSEFSGTGIGLAICEKVVANHGGAITAISQPDKGATFQIYLPSVADTAVL